MLSPAALAVWLVAVPLLAQPVLAIKRYGRSSGVASGAAAPVGAAAMGAWPRAYYGDYHYPQQAQVQPQPQVPLAYPYPPLSYYYEQPRQHPGYGYYNYDDDMISSDPIEDIEEEIQQEAEREQREEALPIGHEMWFEHSSPRDDTAEVNSQFLRNLILSQLYSDEQQRQRAAAAASLYPHAQPPQIYMHPQVQQQVPYGLPLLPEHEERLLADDAAAWEYTSSARQLPYPYGTEEDAAPPAYDEDVVELKSLVKKARQHAASGAFASAQKRPEFVSEVGPWFEGGMRFSDRKTPAGEASAAETTSTSTPAPATTTTTSTTTTARPAFDDKRRGMKEVAMPRPATPVRRPTGTRAGSGSHTSVYDTIRHLLSMEAGLQEKEEVSRRPPQKRFVSSEEALVEQLGGLHQPLST